ncbi:hypothetical protein GBAR_LOCUS19439 [Geodia barretti]|uniref:Steroid 5-alpha reductase C-terminal domain-containing protein n=1 Tax=Geodia barretti TaxID=519541 RepID=A0AA35SRC2_GEOBA|nr:hypothetical protein GBAR_LOCUS19439 [Geodia barretti]
MGNVLGKAIAVDFLIQWGMFLLAAYMKTEKFFDATGSATFVILMLQSLLHARRFFPRQVIQSGMVATWATRLGLFLLTRVLRDGRDSRFNRVRNNPRTFFLYWTVQGVWVWLTALPTLILNSKTEDREIGTRDYIGWTMWLVGMLIEAVADYQKYTFRSNPANRDKWIDCGLWSIVRHPNYLGEILLWTGLFISASSTFRAADYLSSLSPIFVALLLTKISGIPILERQNLKRWRSDQGFMDYMQRTSRLLPYVY